MTSSTSENIKVLVRIRPKTIRESLQHSTYNHLLITNNTLRAITRSDYKQFTFDHIATENSTQQEIFINSAKEICDSVLQGYNGTIFVYGQTGAGKTYTLFGPNSIFSNKSINTNSDDMNDSSLNNSSTIEMDELSKGILPRTIEYLFNQSNMISDYNVSLTCSFLEIYMEQISDLLNTNSNQSLNIVCMNGQVCVDGLTKLSIRSVEEAFGLINKGNKLRHIASTAMNKESSRSHAVFSIYVKTVNKYTCKQKESVFHLIDLAGSERQKYTQTSGERLKEAGVINKSLMCLSFVIQKLSSENGNNKHIHFRDSKLTFLLKDSLGGNSKTCIIANISPLYEHMGETISTLCFAQRAKLIKNKLTLNENDSIDSIYQKETNKMKDKINELKAENLYLLSVIEKTHKIKNDDSNDDSNCMVSQIEQITGNISHINEDIIKLTNEEDFIKDKIQKYCLDITLKEKDYKETNDKIVLLEEKINEINFLINDFKLQNQHLNEKDIQNTININSIRSQNNQTILQINSVIDKSKQALTIKNNELETVNQERNNKEQILKDKQFAFNELLQKISNIQLQNENLLKLEQNQNEQISLKQKQINTIQDTISSLLAKIEKCKIKFNENQNKKKKLCDEFETELKMIPQQINGIEMETKNTKRKCEDIDQQIKEKLSLYKATEHDLYLSYEKMEELKNKINLLNKEEVNLNQEINFQKEKNSKLQNNLKLLDNDNDELVNENEDFNEKEKEKHVKVKLFNQHKAENSRLKLKINELKKEEDYIQKKIKHFNNINPDYNNISNKNLYSFSISQKPTISEITEYIDNQFDTIQMYRQLILQFIENKNVSSSKEIEYELKHSIDSKIQQSIINQQCIDELKNKQRKYDETLSTLNREFIDTVSTYNERLNYSINSYHENNISFEDKKRQTISSGTVVKTPEHINIYKRVFTTKRKYNEFIKFDISGNGKDYNRENNGITRIAKKYGFHSPLKSKNKIEIDNKCLYTQIKITKRKNTLMLSANLRKDKIRTPFKKTLLLP